jgi:transcriptional regulator of acetoin/glycerol metabolism
MPRPTFAPTADQQRILDALAALAAQRASIEAETDKLIAEADRCGIPIDHIARHANHTRKTVYRHLGRPM